MTAFGKFLRRVEGGYMAMCPGCKATHYIAVEVPLGNGAAWTFNGSEDAPTFSPSLLVRTGRAVVPTYEPEPDDPPEVCHSFIRDGRWEFCGDSTHSLAGQTVPLPAEWWENEA